MKRFLKSRWLPWSIVIGGTIGLIVGVNWTWDWEDNE